MAAPTIHHTYVAAAAGSSDVDDIGLAIHAAFIAAGWSIEHADADAIGSGSAGSPAWDKTYVSGALAGTVVYKMPLNGHTTQWFVKFSLGWGTASTRPSMRDVTIGDTHDGSGGVTGGATITVVVASAATNGSGFGISASEDGIAFICPAAGGPKLFVERLRSWAGAVTDDVVAWAANSGGGFLHLRAGVGQVTDRSPVVLAGLAVSGAYSNFGSPASLVNGDGDEVPIVGPFWRGADPFYGPPRLFFFGPEGDYAGLTNYERVVDGGSKTYLALGIFASSLWARYMMATE